MKLNTKILSAVIGIISILTAVSASIEVNRQIVENIRAENELQAIQAANASLIFGNALWNFDDKSIDAGLRSLFQSSSVRRAQVISKGEILHGLKLTNGGKSKLSEKDKDLEIVTDMDPITPPAELVKPLKPFSENPFENLIREEMDLNIQRITTAIWYQPAKAKEIKLIGHLVFEYSLDKAYARARFSMFRIFFTNSVTGFFMILLLLLATNRTVIHPIEILSRAVRRIAEGDFGASISIKSGDEIGQLSSSFDKMRIKIKDFTNNLEDKVKEQTEELRSANVKLRDIDTQKNTFFQNVSHEFRTPLTLIMNPLEIELENRSRKEDDNKNIRTAYNNSKRLFRLVNQLLDFQKYAVNQKQLDLAP
ncbi:MAG: HAMP domain-containing protein, partial [Oligoflexales bacterium]|nr:HAMP domain-containing protein [Oligoflexales bacterium]